MDQINPIVLSIPVYFILIAIEWIIDLLFKNERYRVNDALSNIGCGITEQVSGIFLKVFFIACYTYLFENFRFFEVPVNAFSGLILFLLVDLLYYWAHRLSHEVNLFWIGHIVHHQSEDYNLSVALRQGALQKVFTSPFYWPLAFIGFDPTWFLLTSAFVTLYQFWIHTEYIDKLGWLEWVLNTPSHHRVHHGKNPEYIDKNHAGTLIIWDRIFGTFQKEIDPPTYGVTHQLRTFNPIKATIIPVKTLLKNLTAVNGIKNKFKVLFYGPSWVFHNIESSKKLTNSKFSIQLSPKEITYLLFQFLLFLALVAYTLFYQGVLKPFELSLLVIYIVVELYSLGMFMDGNKQASTVELLRLWVFTPILLVSLNFSFSSLWLGLCFLIIVLSSVALFFVHKNNLKKLQSDISV